MDGAHQRCGRYELLEALAVGGMAELFLARVAGAHGFEKRVVVKKILPHLARDPGFRAMFIDEAKIVASLDHPKIVSVLELGAEAGELYIVMEHVDGLDLLELLKRCLAREQRLPPELAVLIAQDVLDALDFAHHATDDAGRPRAIVHRDISPGNVLVSRRGHVKLTDFGIARAREREQKTETGTLKGKYAYMSPEQILQGPVDASSDQFALGTVLAEMLVGRHLFSASSDLEVLLMVRDVNLHRLDRYGAHIPADLRAILDRALSRRAADRFEHAGAMRDALADWLHEHGLRPRAADLADYLDTLDEPGQTAVVAEPMTHLSTLSGPNTRRQQLDAEARARVGRALFSRGETAPGADAHDDDDDDDIIIDEAEPEEAVADRVADLAEIPALQLLFDIAVAARDGRLVVQRDDAVKEVYFEGGQPVFVRSNLGHERLGQFLVRRRVVREDELERALGVLPQFGGRLGEALVGLGLLRPMAAVRYLGEQVRERVIDLGCWQRGRASWFEAERNPWPAVALELDAYDLVGATAEAMDGDVLEAWGLARTTLRAAAALPRVDLACFGLGERPRRVYDMLDGERTVGELAQHFAAGDERRDFLRLLYLLVCTRAGQLV